MSIYNLTEKEKMMLEEAQRENPFELDDYMDADTISFRALPYVLWGIGKYEQYIPSGQSTIQDIYASGIVNITIPKDDLLKMFSHSKVNSKISVAYPSIPKVIELMKKECKDKELEALIDLLENDDVLLDLPEKWEDQKIALNTIVGAQIEFKVKFTPIAETRKIILESMKDTAVNKLPYIAFGDSLLDKVTAECMDKHLRNNEVKNLPKIPDSSVGYTALCARNLLIEETEFEIVKVIEWLEKRQKTIKQRGLKCPLSLPDEFVKCNRRDEPLPEPVLSDSLRFTYYLSQKLQEDIKAVKNGVTKGLKEKVMSLAEGIIKKDGIVYCIFKFYEEEIHLTKNILNSIAVLLIDSDKNRTSLRKKVH